VNAHFDCASGVSGDKLLAALIDAGAPLDGAREVLGRLGVGMTLYAEDVVRGGVRSLSTRIEAPADPQRRTWADIEKLIAEAALAEPISRRARAIFSRLADAEGEVHGIPAVDVHFHEVGAVDAIGEIVGVSWALDALGVTRVTASAIAVGHGVAESAHGRLPVPAPATALLLRNAQVTAGLDESELTTPTGAAILAEIVDAFLAFPDMTLRRVGHGAGDRETALPNVVRVFLGDPGEVEVRDGAPDDLAQESVVLLATNIDHLTAEEAAFAAEELRGGGTLDVWMTPVHMKKGRPGLVLEALVTPAKAGTAAAEVVRLTGTLGVRVSPTVRFAAPREVVRVDTPYGQIRVKLAKLGGSLRARAEYEDCARAAREHSVPLRKVAGRAEQEALDARES